MKIKNKKLAEGLTTSQAWVFLLRALRVLTLIFTGISLWWYITQYEGLIRLVDASDNYSSLSPQNVTVWVSMLVGVAWVLGVFNLWYECLREFKNLPFWWKISRGVEKMLTAGGGLSFGISVLQKKVLVLRIFNYAFINIDELHEKASTVQGVYLYEWQTYHTGVAPPGKNIFYLFERRELIEYPINDLIERAQKKAFSDYQEWLSTTVTTTKEKTSGLSQTFFDSFVNFYGVGNNISPYVYAGIVAAVCGGVYYFFFSGGGNGGTDGTGTDSGYSSDSSVDFDPAKYPPILHPGSYLVGDLATKIGAAVALNYPWLTSDDESLVGEDNPWLSSDDESFGGDRTDDESFGGEDKQKKITSEEDVWLSPDEVRRAIELGKKYIEKEEFK